MQYNKKKSGFTFVELIVAATIIAILSTLGFLAYSNNLSSSRDTRRISDITTINDALQLLGSKGKLPIPIDSVQLTTTTALQSNLSSPLLTGYQGYFGSELLKQIGLERGGLDPKDNFPYVYLVNRTRRISQIMTFLEQGNAQASLIPQAYAAPDYSARFPKVTGKELGIILSSTTRDPVQEISTFKTQGYFNLNASVVGYTAYLNDKTKLVGSSSFLTLLPNKSCKSIRDNGISNGDGTYKINPLGTAGEIEVYCDMTRDGGGWTLAMKNDGNSDGGALLNSRNTGNGYNISHLTKDNFGLPLTTQSGSATLSDALITAIYTEQYRVESNNNGKVYVKFSPWTSYNASTDLGKLRGCSYSSTANYTISTTTATPWTKGFSLYGGAGGASQSIVDLYAGDPLRFGGWSNGALCPGEVITGDGMRSKVWIR